jgi:hypothetical protein
MCLTTGWTTGRSGFDPRRGQRSFPLSSVSRPALGPTQPPVQWVPGVLSPGVKRGRGVTLTTHPHLMPRSWMSRTLPPSASMACRGTALLTVLCKRTTLLEQWSGWGRSQDMGAVRSYCQAGNERQYKYSTHSASHVTWRISIIVGRWSDDLKITTDLLSSVSLWRQSWWRSLGLFHIHSQSTQRRLRPSCCQRHTAPHPATIIVWTGKLFGLQAFMILV